MRSSYSGSVIGPKTSTCTFPRMFMPAPWITSTLVIVFLLPPPANSSRGNGATHRRAVHQAALGHVVVLDGSVLDRAVVPHQHVPRAPLMAIHEPWLDDVIRQGHDQRLRLVGLHSLDAGAVVAHHVEALATGRRVSPHDRMVNRGIAVDLLLSRRQGPLASTEIEDGPPAIEDALHHVGQGLPGGGARELGV